MALSPQTTINRISAVTRLAVLLVGLFLATGCHGGGGPMSHLKAAQGKIRDQHLEAEQILRTASLTGIGSDLQLEGLAGPWYPESMRAWAHWPSDSEVVSRANGYFEAPERDSPLDIPELLLLLGSLERGGYADLPVKTYVDVLVLRLFAHEVTFFPDPTQEDPPGCPVNELLTDAHSAMGPALRTPLKERLDKVIGRTPKTFTPRERGWALRLVQGETGQLKSTPEEMYHRLCLAAITHEQTQCLPAFESAAQDKTNVAPFRFASAIGAYLLAPEPEKVAGTFAERVFQDSYLPDVYSFQTYRVLAGQHDPATYTAIKTALEKLPKPQHVDYGEFLARYGKPEDLETVLALIETPIDVVDERLTSVHSAQLLDPVSLNLGAATQTPEALAMRDSFVKSMSGSESPTTGTPLPPAITTDPQQAQELADELRVPVSQLHKIPVTAEYIQAQRLWWLRFFPPELVRDRLTSALAKGSDVEKLTALRMLGLYGGSAALPAIARGMRSKSPQIQTEAALWYLAGWHTYQASQAPVDSPSDAPAEAVSEDAKST